MPDPNFFRLQGVPYSWTSGAHFFEGIPYKGVVGVDYSETREVKLVHAAQMDGVPLGTTAGLYKVDSCTFRLLRESAHALLADLTVLGLGSYGDAQFNYTLQLFEPALQVPFALPSTTVISGCRIIKVAEKQEVGIDELVTELSVQAMTLTRLVGPVPLKLWSQVRALL